MNPIWHDLLGGAPGLKTLGPTPQTLDPTPPRPRAPHNAPPIRCVPASLKTIGSVHPIGMRNRTFGLCVVTIHRKLFQLCPKGLLHPIYHALEEIWTLCGG
jgi:hypothetical protein